MKITDSIIRSKLTNVYWVTGGSCAGKTTVIGLLESKYNAYVFPDKFAEYRAQADLDEFPAMRHPSSETDWEWFFNRDVDEYTGWLRELNEYLFEFMIVDLLSEKRDKPIIVDCFIDPQVVTQIAPFERIACMFADDEFIIREGLYREDHKMILDCIQENTSDPDHCIKNVQAASVRASHWLRERADAVGCFIHHRTPETTPDQLLAKIETHFGFEL